MNLNGGQRPDAQRRADEVIGNIGSGGNDLFGAGAAQLERLANTLPGLSDEARGALKTASQFVGAMGTAPAMMSAYSHLQNGMEAFRGGETGRGLGELAQAGATMASAAAPYLAEAARALGSSPGLREALGKMGPIGGGISTLADGLTRMFAGQDRNGPNDTDRAVGALKLAAAGLQFAGVANPGATVAGNLLNFGVDVADKTGLATRAVEGAGQLASWAGDQASRAASAGQDLAGQTVSGLQNWWQQLATGGR